MRNIVDFEEYAPKINNNNNLNNNFNNNNNIIKLILVPYGI